MTHRAPQYFSASIDLLSSRAEHLKQLAHPSIQKSSTSIDSPKKYADTNISNIFNISNPTNITRRLCLHPNVIDFRLLLFSLCFATCSSHVRGASQFWPYFVIARRFIKLLFFCLPDFYSFSLNFEFSSFRVKVQQHNSVPKCSAYNVP